MYWMIGLLAAFIGLLAYLVWPKKKKYTKHPLIADDDIPFENLVKFSMGQPMPRKNKRLRTREERVRIRQLARTPVRPTPAPVSEPVRDSSSDLLTGIIIGSALSGNSQSSGSSDPVPDDGGKGGEYGGGGASGSWDSPSSSSSDSSSSSSSDSSSSGGSD